MRRRIICALLCVFMCLGTVGCGTEEKSVLTVGVGSFNGDLYPFSESAPSDEAVKDMIFTRLLEFDESGVPFLGSESSAVSDSLRIYHTNGEYNETEEFTEGGCTAFEFTLKNGICFSDGSLLTSEDVLFSVYCALDLAAGYLSAESLPVAGLDNYIYQSADAEDYLKIASEILEKGKDYVPADGDGFTEDESDIYWEAFDTAGIAFVSNIVSYVTENYCSDDLVSSYIFDGYTGESVKNSEALKCTYAMRLWNYGNYTYSYVPDENGIFVGVGDENGGYSYKTTLEKALESEDYTEYVAVEDGEYVYDRITAKYRPFEEGDVGNRYSRVLSDKYTVLSRSALTGFRDMAGKLYSLEGEDFPTLSDFFSLMCVSYTADGVFDYQRMESVEAAYEGDSFTKAAAEAFATACVGTHSVDSVEGIKLSASETDGQVTEKIIIYIEGNRWDALYSLDFPIVSKAYFTEGYTPEAESVANYGVPLSSESFAAHLKEKAEAPLGAGAYKLEELSKDDAYVLLSSNEKFNSVSPEFISPDRYGSIKFIDVSGREEKAVNGGEVDICLVSATNGAADFGDNISEYFMPDFSYDYVLVNPAHYININARRAILSVMDTSVATGGAESKAIFCSMPSFMWAYDSAAEWNLFDESTESAKSFFAAAGYTYNDAGELTDPATKQKASFTLTLLPSAKDTAIEAMFVKAAELLKSLGADASVVYDEELLFNIYSGNGVGIYSLGWETDMGGSLYMRYAYTSASDAVKANGIAMLPEGGQIDNFGTVSFADAEGNILEYNQADAVAILNELILTSDAGIDMEVKKTAYTKALSLIRELSFELPVCQRGITCYVNGSVVDVSTLNEAPTVFSSLISEPWKITPVSVQK